MQIFKNRPLALSACFFAVLSVIGLSLSARAKLLLLCFVGVSFLVLLLVFCFH